MEPQVTNKKRWWRWLWITPASILGLLLLAFGLLQLRWVQNILLERYLGKFQQVTGYHTEWKDFYLSWYDQLEIKGLAIHDPRQQPIIKAGELTIDFRFMDLFRDSHINLDAINISDADLNLTYEGTDSLRQLNISRFLDTVTDYFSPGPSTDSTSQSRPFELSHIKVRDFRFSISDSLVTVPDGRFNPSDFSLDVSAATAEHLSIRADTLQIRLNGLSGKIRNQNWPISNLTTSFRLTGNGMDFFETRIDAGKSSIGDTLSIHYGQLSDLTTFSENVRFDLRLSHTRIHPDDIRFFIGKFPLPDEPVLITGHVSGSVPDLRLRNLELATGNTQVTGNVELEGLPDLQETFINAKLKTSIVDLTDFRFALPPNVRQVVQPLGAFRVGGNFTGFINDFVANAAFSTRFGRIVSDVNFKVDEKNPLESSYRGKLQLMEFQVGRFLKDTSVFQDVTLAGMIQGKGLSVETADFLLDGTIQRAGILGYQYQNIRSKARFANQFFVGGISIDDPNIRMNAEGSVDLRNGKDEIRLYGKVDTLVVAALRLADIPLRIRTDFTISTRGLNLDALEGRIKLRNILLQQEERSLRLDSAVIRTDNQAGGKHMVVSSSVGSLDVRGNFRYANLAGDVREIIHEFYLNATNDRAKIKEYYASKKVQQDSYRIDFLLRMNDLNPTLAFFETDCTVSRNVQVAGHFISGLTTILHAYSAIPRFTWGEQVYTDNEIDFNGSKLHDSTSVLAMLLVSSAKQQLTPRVRTSNLIMEAIWNQDHIDLGLDVDQEGYDNNIRMKSEIDFLSDSIRIKVLPSQIRVLGNDWKINPRNRILIKGKEVEVRELELLLGERSMKLSGRISEDPSLPFKVQFKDLTLDLVNSLMSEKLDGTLNGNVELRGLYGVRSIQNEFQIQGFTINGFLAGDIEGTSIWDPDQESFVLRFSTDRMQRRIIDVTGLYTPQDPVNPINLTARFNQTQLKIFEPLARGIFSNFGGTLSGTFDINGTFSNPKIVGSANIEDGKITVDYLNTNYGVRGLVQVNTQTIEFRNLELRDPLQNKGTLGGTISHKNFSDFTFNLNSEFRNFQALNTTIKQNKLFFGQAYGTGTFSISGPMNRLHLAASVRSEKNTRIYIPLEGTETVERGSFIRFVSLRDSAGTKSTSNDKPAAQDFSMSLNLDITPDAYAEIIFDKKAGDIIRGSGLGNLKLDIDTKGEFTMFGGFEFERGGYNFTLGGVINKEFSISKGSKISWIGDPYGATLNIQASYRQLASLAPIMPQGNNPNVAVPNSLRRKFPIEVLLTLDGPMLSPQINFDITARDLPENLPGDDSSGPIPVKFQFNAFKARLDEQELKKQVFSLVVLRKFTPPDAFTTSGGIANSVSELLSNQLSYWLSQVDQNLEVTLDLGSLDQDAFNISQLRMSYSLMNGRLRITRDGTLFSNQYTQSNVAALAGDWMVDYLLTPDGKFKVKMYSRSNFNMLLSSLNTQSSYTTGLSLSHTQSFNRFSDLLRAEHRRQLTRPVTDTDSDQQ